MTTRTPKPADERTRESAGSEPAAPCTTLQQCDAPCITDVFTAYVFDYLDLDTWIDLGGEA